MHCFVELLNLMPHFTIETDFRFAGLIPIGWGDHKFKVLGFGRDIRGQINLSVEVQSLACTNMNLLDMPQV
jgi:hypothetical protein